MATTATRVDKEAKLRILVTSFQALCVQENLDTASITFGRSATVATFTYQGIGWRMNNGSLKTKARNGSLTLKKGTKKRKA